VAVESNCGAAAPRRRATALDVSAVSALAVGRVGDHVDAEAALVDLKEVRIVLATRTVPALAAVAVQLGVPVSVPKAALAVPSHAGPAVAAAGGRAHPVVAWKPPIATARVPHLTHRWPWRHRRRRRRRRACRGIERAPHKPEGDSNRSGHANREQKFDIPLSEDTRSLLHFIAAFVQKLLDQVASALQRAVPHCQPRCHVGNDLSTRISRVWRRTSALVSRYAKAVCAAEPAYQWTHLAEICPALMRCGQAWPCPLEWLAVRCAMAALCSICIQLAENPVTTSIAILLVTNAIMLGFGVWHCSSCHTST
jgi:hypothetical protein